MWKFMLLLYPLSAHGFVPGLQAASLTARPVAHHRHVIKMVDDDLPKDVTTSKRPLWMPPEKSEEEKQRDAAMGADFEFDATSVTALLGAAIAFQFFVVANL